MGANRVTLATCVSVLALTAAFFGYATAVPGWVFPFSNCYANGTMSPYILTGPAPRVVDDVLVINFTIAANPNAVPGDKRGCYNALTNNLFKINVNSGQACRGKVRVVVNGVRKRANLFWDVFPDQDDAVLRITKLNLTTNAIGSTIDLLGLAPCNTVEALAGPAGGEFKYYMTDHSLHRCCPVNTWNWGADFPPAENPTPVEPSPSLPSPPSPSIPAPPSVPPVTPTSPVASPSPSFPSSQGGTPPSEESSTPEESSATEESSHSEESRGGEASGEESSFGGGEESSSPQEESSSPQEESSAEESSFSGGEGSKEESSGEESSGEESSVAGGVSDAPSPLPPYYSDESHVPPS